MQRFYLLAIQPTLFGGTSLVGTWGRIGTGGQMVIAAYIVLPASTCGAA